MDSAVLTVENISKKLFEASNIDEKFFFEVVKAGFAHKRKVAIKNLEKIAKREDLKKAFEDLNIPDKARPENIRVEKWITLVSLLCK